MSTLEKTMELLRTMPESQLDTVYTFLQFIKFKESQRESQQKINSGNTSAFGIAHKHANPDLIPLEKEAFANAMAEKHAID